MVYDRARSTVDQIILLKLNRAYSTAASGYIYKYGLLTTTLARFTMVNWMDKVARTLLGFLC